MWANESKGWQNINLIMMLNRVVLASNNPEKQRVTNEVWRPDMQVLSPRDFGYQLPDDIEGEEDYPTNARIKADWVGVRVKLPVIADDSGMEIKGLGGRPGVSTRRWADGANDERLIARTVEEIRGLSESERACTFRICAIYRDIKGKTTEVVEQDDGVLLLEPQGAILPGHPLASLLYLQEHGATLAELINNPDFVAKDIRAHKRLKDLLLKSI